MHHRTLWLIVGILGVCALVVLVCFGGLMALMSILPALVTEGPPNVSGVLQAAGLVALGLGIGVPLALQGWTGWREHPSRPFNPPRAWWLWLALGPAFVILVTLGVAIGWLPQVINLPVPPATITWIQALLLAPTHALTMSILPLAALGLVGWGLRGTGGTQRDVVIGIAGGGCLGMGISMVAEILVIVAIVIVVIVVVILTPGGVDRLNELSQDMRDPAWQQDVSNMMDLILSPVVIASLFGLLCVVIPLLEEAFKTLGGSVIGYWVRPYPGRAFLWGVAAGAGFALAENLLNGAVEGAESWAPLAAARIGATAMHCLASGILGWGWGQLWTERRPLRLLAAYAAAVILHGLWNAAAVGIAYAGTMALAQGEAIWASIPGLVAIVIVAIIGLLTLSFIAALFLIGRRLAAQREDHLQDSIVIPEAAPYPPPRLPIP